MLGLYFEKRPNKARARPSLDSGPLPDIYYSIQHYPIECSRDYLTPPKPDKKKKKDDKTEKSEKEKPKKEKKSGQKIDQTPTKSDNPGPSGEGKAMGYFIFSESVIV